VNRDGAVKENQGEKKKKTLHPSVEYLAKGSEGFLRLESKREEEKADLKRRRD